MPHYLDPRHDLIFRRVFGEHENLCMSLLNNMLPLDPGQQIVELEYRSPDLLPQLPVLKDSIVDVRCTDNRGRQFLVEMQMYWTDSFKSRVLLNASKAYVSQLDRGTDFKLLQPVYALSFLNDIFEKESTEYYHYYKIVNLANTKKRIDGLEFVFIELPKFQPDGRGEKKLYDLWLTFLTRADETENPLPALLEEEVTREALHYLEISSYTKAELDTYDHYWDAIRVRRAFKLDGLEEGRAEGRAEGLVEGRAEGLAEGRAEGIKIGEEKGIEKSQRSIVLNALRTGLSVAQIQAITGLSEEKIQEISRQ
ncbi:MAG: Rpn family recombination-promoting nuclease/putative transposase [Odoribacteraceae bacterium]|nr:Rpn family recombination-promoting nuclease/putative transposase [Odoribacteraceae bacterium]